MRRLTPEQALMHPFFDELRDEEVYTRLKREYQIGDLFDFRGRGEVRGTTLERLVPKWYRG